MTIGLYGGSFNPPHAAHRMVGLLALRRLGLDRVWWLVSPGNPLKDNSALPSLAERMAAARRMAAHPRIVVTDVEAAIGVSHTYDAVAHLKARCPGVAFVWVMGADNLVGFHRWERWRDLARLVPIAVVDRPGFTWSVASARAARALTASRVPERDAWRLPHTRPPAWCFLHELRSPLSSTALRTAAQARSERFDRRDS
jgi:nicotinate-nucleotide adenylyltransferase